MANILFITPTHIGDAILCTGVIRAFLDKHQNEPGHFWLATNPLAASLFQAEPRLTVYPLRINQAPNRDQTGPLLYPIKKLWRALQKRWRMLQFALAARSIVWDEIIDTSFTPSLILKKFLSFRKLRTITTIEAGEHREPICYRKTGRVFVKVADGSPIHESVRAARIAGLDEVPMSQLWLTERAHQKAEQLLGKDGNILAICPTASTPRKEWPMESLTTLIEKLTENGGLLEGARVFFSGSPEDRVRCHKLVCALPKEQVIDGFGAPLDVTAAVFSRARLFIGNDSGMMHLAAASGAPTLGLFGLTDERRYAPVGPRAYTIRHAASFSEALKHRPEGESGYDAAIRTIRELSVEEVMTKIREIFEETS